MTKLMAPMLVAMAVWLTVTLVVIVRATHSTPSLFTCFGGCFTRAKNPGPKLADLSEKKLLELGESYVKTLHKKSDSIGYDEVNVTLTKLYDLHRQYKNFHLTTLGLSDSWKNLVYLQYFRDKCNQEIVTVSDYASATNEHQRRFAFECFRDYLEKCGFEERFKEITNSIREKSHQHRDSYTFPTFDSYLEAEFWSRKSWKSSIYEIKSDLKMLLSAVRELPALGEISSDSGCPNRLTANLLYWRANVYECQDFFNDYLALYLDACGYEERFKRIVDSIEQPADKSHFFAACPTLNSYFKEEFSTKLRNDLDPIREELDNLLLVVKGLTDKIDCNDESKNKLMKLLFSGSQPSEELKNMYFARYLKDCGFEESFDKAIVRSNQGIESWDSATYPTLYSYLRQRSRNQFRLNRTLSIIKDFSTVENISQETDCTEKLEHSLIEGISNGEDYPELQELIKRYFALYLDKCGYEERFKRIVNSIKQPTEKSSFSAVYPTLNTYLEREFFTKVRNNKDSIGLELVNLLSVMRDFTDETNCNEGAESKLKESVSDRSLSSKGLERIYFARYLENCGYQESFTNVKVQHKIFANERNLINYLFRDSLKESKRFAKSLSSTLSVINKLANFGQNEGSKCNKESIEFIHELRSHEGKAAEDALKRDIDRLCDDQAKVCANQLKLKAEKFKQDNAEEWKLIEKSTNIMVSKLTQRFQLNPDLEMQSYLLPEVARELDGGSQNGISDVEVEENFIGNLRADCDSLLDHMDQDLYTMSLSCEFSLAAKYDFDVKKFMKYLSCCWRISSRSDARIESMFHELDMPFYPKKISLSQLKQAYVEEERALPEIPQNIYEYAWGQRIRRA